MILPILPEFKFDHSADFDHQDGVVYFGLVLRESTIACECKPTVKFGAASIGVCNDPQFDEDIEFENRVLDSQSVITVNDSTEENLIELKFGLTEVQLSEINLVLEEYFLDLHIKTEKEKANDY